MDTLGKLTVQALDIEAAGVCNADCVFCPRDTLRSSRGAGIMSEETFARVLDRFGGYLRFVGFAGIGEPTLNRSLSRFVRQLTERHIDSMLVTNASLLVPSLVDDLLDAGIGTIQVSFNGHDESSRFAYESDMRRLDYGRTKDNVERLIRRAAGRAQVLISAVETKRNGPDLAGFVRYWCDLGVPARVVPCHSRGGTIDLAPRNRAASGGDRGNDLPPRCELFASRTFITWDGRVLACCHDIRGETVLGTVADDAAETIVARKLEVMRRGDWFPVCRSCDEPARHSPDLRRVRALCSDSAG